MEIEQIYGVSVYDGDRSLHWVFRIRYTIYGSLIAVCLYIFQNGISVTFSYFHKIYKLMHVMRSDICCRSRYYLNTDILCCWCCCSSSSSWIMIVRMPNCWDESELFVVLEFFSFLFFSFLLQVKLHDVRPKATRRATCTCGIEILFFSIQISTCSHTSLTHFSVWHVTNSQMQFPAMPSKMKIHVLYICDKRMHCIPCTTSIFSMNICYGKVVRNFYGTIDGKRYYYKSNEFKWKIQVNCRTN